jgi:hypothetical protein
MVALYRGDNNMANEQQSPNPYVAVLADLERQRDQINTTIAMIKRMMGLSTDEPLVSSAAPQNGGEASEIRSDTFFGMSISEAVKKYLAMMKRPRRVTDIARALDEGGLLHGSKNWLATVQTTLTRMKGVVVRVPNGWGLMEWYPGRKFEKKPAPPSVKRPFRTNAKKRAATKKPPTTRRPEALATKLDASRQIQGRYLVLLKKVPADQRERYKSIAAKEGREQAIKAMADDLNE